MRLLLPWRAALLILVLSAVCAPLLAQVYPVTLVAQSNPPHTGNLAELAAPGFNRLGASLILNDRNELSYQVRLVIETVATEKTAGRIHVRPDLPGKVATFDGDAYVVDFARPPPPPPPAKNRRR